MLAGKVIDEFECEGKHVRIRYPEMSDLDDLLEFINTLIRERAYVTLQEELSREAEIDWLLGTLEKNEKGEKVHLVVEVDGKVVGGASVEKREGAFSHVGNFGISLKKSIRGMGIGTRLADVIFSEAKKRLGVEMIVFNVFEKNDRARKFYRKLGFEETGRIEDGVKIDGEYQDSIVMQKELE